MDFNAEDDVVQKAPNDMRLYRVLDLENGLFALLVHDPPYVPPNNYEHNNTIPILPTKKASAAMSVGVGSFCDPVEAQGLAHLLEHMLFIATEKFPEENEFRKFLFKHGGFANAYTEVERTTYYFDVKQEFLKDALTRFSQFFVSPILKSEAIERELLSIDSEFDLHFKKDSFRLQQLQRHTSICGNPLNKFLHGNKRSLDGAAEKGINLRDQISKFYEDYYHGGLMKLVVIGGESLDVLQSWVVELFGAVKKGPRVSPKFNVEGPIWKSGKIYRLEAVKEVHMLVLTWALPCLHNEYLKKPDHYLALLLRQSGRGSLLNFLRATGWVVSLCPDVNKKGISSSCVVYFFMLSIHLTDYGVEKIFDIIGFVYQYLKLLRQASLQEWIFEMLKTTGDMLHKSKACYSQVELAENLQYFPSELVLYGCYAYKTWDEQLIKRVLGYLIPDHMRVDFVSKSFPKSEDYQCEPWCGSCYVEEDIDQNLMELWTNPPEIDASLHLPTMHEFMIPNDLLSIWTGDWCLVDFATSSTPECILDNPLMKVWYKVDDRFGDLMTNAYFLIHLNCGYANAKDVVLASLFGFLLEQELYERIHQTSEDPYLFTSGWPMITRVGGKLELKFTCSKHYFQLQFCEVCNVIRNFSPSDDQFQVAEEVLKRSLENSMMDPTEHCSYLRTHVLSRMLIDIDEELHLLNNFSLNDLMEFAKELVSRMYIESLYLGNLSEEEATSLPKRLKKKFKKKFRRVNLQPIEVKNVEPVICLPSSANLVRDDNVKNKSEKTSVVEIYFQIEQDTGMESIKLTALIDLFNQIVQAPFFNQLRAKEQLGYKIECGPLRISHVFGFVFRIVSSKYNPVYLQGRIDSFINGLEKLLDYVDSDSFEHYKDGLTAVLLPAYVYHADACYKLWSQIVDQRYIFDEPKRKAEELRNIIKEDVVEFYKMYFEKSSPLCRRLITRVWGCNTDMKDAEALPKSDEEQVINDVAAFKDSCEWYPSIF